jgi:succinate dehydrogenase / fumarate reductase, cytochrome b subunit
MWTAGITWGLWTTPVAQKRANYIAVAIGLLVAIAGAGAIVGARNLNVEQARSLERVLEERREWLRGAEVSSESAVVHSASK